ncbi:hypothetical protein DAEQUDRAFT_756890 [Daedalea quercina L-15889]|uniref:Iminophenyl-pyruvate dimer synthase domain-containing protein n=1 Tax=Daedalea quercina L-15889 TaxID=1314783 RepID=A0A165QIP4_9APHY|nr:hypothetical protein DAEQUDRAFT_756890 [Daedalea quercina L-15889]
MASAAAHRHNQPYEPVRGIPVKWDKQALIDHVKTGMQVELGTLPIYFCALYSIKRDNGEWGTKARANILCEEFFDSAMTIVTDKATALQALETIVDQGEGSIGVPDSHYSVFVELYQRRKEWDCVEYVDEPKTDDYKDNKVAYSVSVLDAYAEPLTTTDAIVWQLSLAVNAAYCYLLQTLDLCWHNGDRAARKQILRNIHRIMIDILSPAAHVLVEQQVGTEGKYAAPCFEFYPAGKDPLSPADLFTALKKELESAKAAAQSQETVAAIGKILLSLNGIITAK